MKSVCMASLTLFIMFIAACATTDGIYHEVKRGDTLYRLSRTYDIPVDKLKKENNIPDERAIMPGDYIFIPGVDTPRTIKRSSAGHSQKKPTKKRFATRAGRKKKKTVPAASGRFAWPVDGVITSPFGQRNGTMHEGMDISAPEGTPVVASAAGKVLYAGERSGYGNVIIIRHSGNWITVYAHNSRNIARQGENVKKGQKIALVGETGRATGPHLHFEIRKGIKPVNPARHLPAAP